MTAPALSLKELRRVVIAAAVGNVIEWYDFYIFGSLAALLSVKFFAAGASRSALIKTVGTFTAGFLIHPFGAFVFGRVGDLVGRKYTFLITLSGMGLSTALIGFVPSYARIGAAAGILLLLLRLIQGLCLGGEYGGVQRVGVADPLPAVAPHGGDRHLYPAAASGDADLPGYQGEGTDVGQSLAGGLLESEHQIRADRQCRRDRRRGRVVQRPVLG